MDVFELSIWKGDWGLPTVDTECLQVLVYAKFNDIPLKINANANPFNTPNGRLPVLKCKNDTFNAVQDIIAFFRQQHYNSEYDLSRKHCATVMAYEAFLKEKLFPALQFIWWIDKENADKIIRPLYSKALPFPFNFYYPAQYERKARTLIQVMFPVEEDMTVIENKVYSEAQKCLTLLSTSLGDSKYFLDKGPTVLDAIVYSYLAPLLKANLPNSALQNHLKACTNLVAFVSRISDKYFASEGSEYQAKETAQNIKKYSHNEFPNKRRNQIFAGVFTALLMTTYALSSGILEVNI
ncbi:Metaxin-1, partial [Eufriesea mexicana]